MSWNLNSDGPATLDEIQGLEGDENVPDGQLQAAKAAAKELVRSGAVGDGPYIVSFAGHDNPADAPSVSVAITGAPPVGS